MAGVDRTERVPIGGHDGLAVWRVTGRRVRRGPMTTWIRKEATTEQACEELANEVRMLVHLSNSGVAPELLGHAPDFAWLEETDEGPEVRVSGAHDPLEVRWSAIAWLSRARARRVFHGDLMPVNLVAWAVRMVAVDWHQAGFVGSEVPPKRPESDSWQLCRALRMLGADPDRRAEKWMLILEALGVHLSTGTPLLGWRLIDYGCNTGEMVALACCEGMQARGIEINDELPFAQSPVIRYGTHRFQHADVLLTPPEPAQVALCLSVWPYLVAQDEPAATAFLRGLIAASGTVFFETQYAGDGPGYGDRVSTAELLTACGAQYLAVVGQTRLEDRHLDRDLWMVRG